MSREAPIVIVTRLAMRTSSAFRGAHAVDAGVSRKQLTTLGAQGAIERVFSDTFRLTAALRTHDQLLHGALLFAGPTSTGTALRGRPGVGALRRLADQLDPRHPANSTLEVKTRRLRVAHGFTDFVRELRATMTGGVPSTDGHPQVARR